MNKHALLPMGHYHILHSHSSSHAKAMAGQEHHSPFKERFSHKIEINAKEMKAGRLHSGSKHGPLVHNRKQMIAISASQARKGEG